MFAQILNKPSQISQIPATRSPLDLLAKWENFERAAEMPHPDPRLAEAWLDFAVSLTRTDIARLADAKWAKAKRVGRY